MESRRIAGIVTAFGLLYVSFSKTEPPSQTFHSASLPGLLDLSFWVNRNGLKEFDVRGKVGFGDMARILLRRRSNAESIRPVRDRFLFRTTDFRELHAPDVFRVKRSGEHLEWVSKPERLVAAAGRIINIPLIVENGPGKAASLEAEISGAAESGFSTTLESDLASGYFLRDIARVPGSYVRRLVVKSGGASLTADVTMDVRPLAKMHVKLVDESDAAAAARIYVTGSDGLAYAPEGAISRIAAMPGDYYFYARGEFDLELPVGRTELEATQGLEYALAHHELELRPAPDNIATLVLKRWENMAKKGWFSGDAHIHANYTGRDHQIITPADIFLQVTGEDLNNANLMVANSYDDYIHDEKFFEGKPNRLSKPNNILYWNEEMRNKGLYGHLCLWNLKNLVRPLLTGFEDTPNWEDYPANYAAADNAQKQGGAVTYAHPGYVPTFQGSGAKELPIDVTMDVIDAMDVLSNNFEPATTEIYHRLLNCGFHLAISAGTDSFTNEADMLVPGAGRVYVHSGAPMNYAKWIREYKRGRSFASNGPMIFFTVDGKEPGTTLQFDEGSSHQVEINVQVHSELPLDTVDVFVNGEKAISKAAGGKKTVSFQQALSLSRTSWIAVEALGPWHRLLLNDAQLYAHTSPVYVNFGRQRTAVRKDVRFFEEWIDSLITMTSKRGHFSSPERREEVLNRFRSALEFYRRLEQSAWD